MPRSRSTLLRASALVATLCGSLSTLCFVVRPAGTSQHARSLRCRLKAEAVDISVTDIEDEVARLRAEVAALEQDKVQKEKQEQADVFRTFDVDGNGKVDADELRSGVKDLWGVEVDTMTASRVITKLGSSEGSVLQSTEFDLKRMEDVLNEVVAESQAAKAKEANDLQKKQDDALQRATTKALKDLGVGDKDPSEETAAVACVGSVFAYGLPTLDTFRFSQALLHFSWAAPLLSIMDFGNQILYGSPFGLGSLIIFIAMQRISSDATQPFLLRFNMWQAALMSMFYFVPGCLRIFATIGSQAALGSYDKWGDWSPGSPPENLSDAGNTLVFVMFGSCILYSVVSSMMGVRPRIPWLSEQVEKTLPPGR
mmetsp:Transcript_78380/g.151392  ORF Transcript_78380/g.151392 Transcript_78380/m.151392 type:complete len:369 (+) Transcript_78380:91-1197(+)